MQWQSISSIVSKSSSEVLPDREVQWKRERVEKQRLFLLFKMTTIDRVKNLLK